MKGSKDTQQVEGSCLCNRIGFRITGTFEGFFLCHCKRCQKDSGSAHAANLFSQRATIEWLSGSSNVQTYNLPNTRHSRSFCKTCGSALPNLQGELLVVPAGSLDSAPSIKPNAHIYCKNKAHWDEALEKVPRFDELPQ
ncbi:MAG: GFA family protein [bacterium]|nr:GFA family protein [bacterium]